MTTATSKFEFVEDLPARSTGVFGHRDAKQQMFSDFAEALRQNPGTWAKYPTQNAKSFRQIAWGIRKCTAPSPLALRTGEFDAALRAGMLYVRYEG